MRIVVVGAGPAGLYFSLLMKKANPSHDITVIERNPPNITYGWGVVFSEETLGALRDADPKTHTEITDTFATWDAIDIKYRGQTIRSRGHSFSAIARKELLSILQRRCSELGVELRFQTEVDDPSEFGEADLLVGADGLNSVVRRSFEDEFRPTQDVQGTRFIWFGTNLVFKAFTFIFRQNEHGLLQVHAYPFDGRTSTFIVECHESTWRRAGLDAADEAEGIAYCERLFAEDLAGHRLLSNRSLWISFVTLRSEVWHHGRVVLLGDAAHTAHFTIGSGTKLAMEDAISLAAAFERHGPSGAGAALIDYEMERQPLVERFQQAAQDSSAYFENVSRYAGFEPIQFAFNLLTRSGRIGHLNLELRDPRFVTSVDGWFARRLVGEGTGGPLLVAPPPLLVPLALNDVNVTNRVTLSPCTSSMARDGSVTESYGDRLAEAAESGAGLVLTGLTAVCADGRVSPESPGLYQDEHVDVWHKVVQRVHAGTGAKVGVLLGHAGRRGSTRPAREGLDRPLRDGGWPVVSASALPYTRRNQIPQALDRLQMVKLIDQFRAATHMAAKTGSDMLEIDFAHGYLLASFLSPLTNRRTDEFGGPLQNRMRFPLDVFDAARSVWPENLPLAARLTGSDWVRGGFDEDDAVTVARALKERGCDLIHVVTGQTVPHDLPTYGHFYLVPYSDRIRNEAGIPTLVGGNLITADEINTILAAGRADLCILDIS